MRGRRHHLYYALILFFSLLLDLGDAKRFFLAQDPSDFVVSGGAMQLSPAHISSHQTSNNCTAS
jgi:hypothetical protein